MKLNLTVEGRILASVSVEAANADEYHLKAFRRLLIIRHRNKLRVSNQKPLFSLEQQAEKKKHGQLLPE